MGMNDTYPMLKSLGIDRLSIPDRLHLLEELWDSIAETPEAIPLTDAQRAELDRRLASRAANPNAGSSWEEVKARLQKRP
jgi:putative addiction module component (TIGR02574 family)